MLSRTSEYALRAATALAGSNGRPLLSHELAELTGVSPPYLKKVLRLLTKAELLRSRPGPGGGFLLARAPEQISLLDVVNAVEPFQRLDRCPLGLEEHTELCPLHRRIDEAVASIERAFGSTTLDGVARSFESAPTPPRQP